MKVYAVKKNATDFSAASLCDYLFCMVYLSIPSSFFNLSEMARSCIITAHAVMEPKIEAAKKTKARGKHISVFDSKIPLLIKVPKSIPPTKISCAITNNKFSIFVLFMILRFVIISRRK